jgi:hypothetical protein
LFGSSCFIFVSCFLHGGGEMSLSDAVKPVICNSTN